MRGSALDVEQAMSMAESAAGKAYAPYSGFRVGATVVTESGEAYSGCNVENASYGLATCAERNAVAAMVLAGEGSGMSRISYVAVTSPGASTAFPCGACRQVLHEFGCREVFVREAGNIKGYPFDEILPNAFGPRDLRA
jgi:cytidine deaminase